MSETVIEHFICLNQTHEATSYTQKLARGFQINILSRNDDATVRKCASTIFFNSSNE